MNMNRRLPGAEQLLNKYLENKCTPEEEQKVLRWYFSFTEEDDLPLGEEERSKMLSSVKNKVLSATTGATGNAGTADRDNVKQRFQGLRSRNSIYMRVAALLAVFCSVAFFGIYKHYRSGKDTSPYLELRAQAGERKTITLADGTRIWLNNSSVLRYPVKFDQNTREVKLEGEAFFEVAHNAKKPFLIHTTQLKVQVLGTSFNVRSYAADKETAVHVATGKVAVYNQFNKIMLVNGEQVVYDRLKHNFTRSVLDPEISRAWQNNTLAFRYETLENICLRLERWYDVKVVIRNEKLLHKRYTLEQHNETLENVMKVLCAGELSYKIDGRSVTIW